MNQSFWQETYFQEFQSACKQNPSCQLLEGVDRLNCIRECISPSCYIELYQGDKVCSYRALGNFEIVQRFDFLFDSWKLARLTFGSNHLKDVSSNAESDVVDTIYKPVSPLDHLLKLKLNTNCNDKNKSSNSQLRLCNPETDKQPPCTYKNMTEVIALRRDFAIPTQTRQRALSTCKAARRP